jgi:uncharacterized membrane protein
MYIGSGTADASLVLFALTLLVTPANIYMLTHGAKLPPVAMEPVPVAGITSYRFFFLYFLRFFLSYLFSFFSFYCLFDYFSIWYNLKH